MIKPLATIFVLALLTGCAGQKLGTTLPGETEHIAIGTGYTDDDSTKMAAHTAKHYCEQQMKRHAIKSIESEYRGIVTEKTRGTLDAIGSIAAVTGAWIPTPGNDTDYKTTVSFTCI